jgi:cell division protein FtsA
MSMRKGSTKARNGIVATLDLGTTKTTCLIARVDGGVPRVTGIGMIGSKGIKAGTIADIDAAEKNILSAVHAAEQMAGETIQGVIVSMTGGNLSSRVAQHELSIDNHEIADADVRRVLEAGRQNMEPTDRTMLHTIPVGFTIDGSRGIRDPRGMYGQRLGVNMHVVSASTSALKTLAMVIARCHLELDGVVAAPYAAGMSVLVPDEREMGCTLIDLGGGVTTMAVFFDGKLVFTDSVPIGGGHVTTDIARGLSTPLAHAERMKTLYGAALVASADEREIIEVPLVGEDDRLTAHHIPKSILTGIIQPRLEETFELVRSRLEASGLDKIAGRRAVLSGGASQLSGVRDLAAHILDKQVRVGKPQGFHGLPVDFAGPAYATCTGLIAHALQPTSEPAKGGRKTSAAPPTGMIGRLGLWLKENF